MNYHHVAVYGSLLSGFGNHILLRDSELVTEGLTAPVFDMYSLGGFPGIIPTDHGTEISVEIYQVSEAIFQRLDHLEGYPRFYDRKEITVKPNSVDPFTRWSPPQCWIYFLPETSKEEYTNLPLIESGSWRHWNEHQRTAS